MRGAGNLPMSEHVIEAGVAMIPSLARVRVLRSWAASGHVHGRLADHRQDPYRRSLSQRRLVLTAASRPRPPPGWCFAHTIARDEPHPLNAAYRLDRFRRGYMLDEKGQGATPNLH